MGEFEILAALCMFAMVIAIVAAVGHGLWLAGAAMLRAFATPPPIQRERGQRCPQCGSPSSLENGRCSACGAVPAIRPGDKLREELLATARQLRRMLDQGRISQVQYDDLAVQIQADLARFGGAIPPLPPPPVAADSVVEAQLVESEPSPPATGIPFGSQDARPSAREPRVVPAFAPNLATAQPAAQPASPPLAQVIAEPLKPARSLADMLQSFMEESNIRWGEILAALLIVVSSVGLVFSLRATLKSIPYFPALLFMLFTVLFHGAGIYTLRRWKLHAVSRVVLIISLLLVPLAVSGAVLMSGSGEEQRQVTDPLFLLAMTIGAAVFAWVSWSASRELVSEGHWRLAAGVLGCSLSQVLVQRVDFLQMGLAGVNLVAAVPLACFLLATVGQLARARGWKQVSRKRAGEIFLVLGVATFALAAPLTLLFLRAEPRWLTASWLSPALSFAAAAVLALGLVVHRRATARDLAAIQTAGTAVLILGGFLMLLLVFFAWPEPELLCAVGVVNGVMLVGLALAARLPLLQAPAIACFALAAVMGLHLAQGRFAGRAGLGMQIVEASLMARSSLVLTLLAAVTAAIGLWQRRPERHRERDDWLVPLASSGVLACLGIAIAAVAGFIEIPGWQQDADLAGPMLLVYAVCLIAAGTWTPWPAVAAVGSCLLWAGLVQVTTFNATIRGWLAWMGWLPDRSLFVATLAHGVSTALVAALATGRQILAPRDEFQSQARSDRGERLVLPLAALAVLSLVAAFPAIFWVWNERFGWHATYALWAAAAWGAVALATRWKWAVSGMQVMLLLAPGFLIAGSWKADLGEHWLLAPGHLHGQLLILPCAAIFWSLVRRLSSGNELTRELLEAPWPPVDHLVLVRAAVIVPILALVASLGDLGWELGFDPAADAVAQEASAQPANPLLAIHGRGFWLLAAMIVALVVSLWEHVTRAALITLGIVTFTAVWLAAQFWHDTSAVASAARWAAGIYATVWALPFILREPIGALAKRLTWLRWKSWSGTLWRRPSAPEPGTPEWAFSTVTWFCAQPLVLGGLTVLILTVIAVAQNAEGVALRGPAAGSIFQQMGPTASYAVPLLALVGVLLGYAVRERQAAFALAGSVVFQLAINLAFILHVSLAGVELPTSVRTIEWLQWNAAAAGAYALIWLSLSRWIMPAEDRPQADPLAGAWGLVTLQIVAGCGLALAMVVWAAASVVANPTALAAETQQLGHWLSYFATACVLAALGWRAAPALRSGWADIVVWLAAACISFVACTADAFDTPRTWLSYHILTGGWLTLGVLAVVLVCAARWRPAFFDRFAPDHLTAAALAALTTFLAIRGTYADPGQPWWSLAATVGPLVIATAMGVARRSQLYAYASVALAGLTVTLFVIAPKVVPWWRLVFGGAPPLALVDLAGLAMVLAAGFWLACEVWAQSQRGESFSIHFRGPRVHAVTLLGWLGLLAAAHAIYFLPLHWWETLGDRLAAISLVAVLGATLLAAAWDRRAVWWIAALYVWGLVAWTLAVSLTADHYHLDFAARSTVWLLAVACHLALTGQIWSYGANVSLLGTRFGVSDPIGGLKRTESWLPPANLVLASVVCLGQLGLVLSLDRLELRVAAAWSPAVAGWGILCLAQEKRRDVLQVLSLLMAGLTAVYLGWAQLDPREAEATWGLTRAFRLLMVLSAVTFVYGLVLPRWLLTAGRWNAATRQAGYLSGAAAIATFVAVLGLEVMLFTPGVDAPIEGVQVGAIAVVLLGLIAGLVSLAVLPGRDPLTLTETGRQWYVYAAEATGALLFAHLYICRPTWFDTALRPYWPLIIMGIAFVGVGASELCHRFRIRVLAEPLERTGSLLPLLPALGWWIVSASRTDYSLLLFSAGVLYLVLSVTRKSWAAMAAAAVAGNGALWALLHNHGLDLTSNPQFWLIPPALSVLAAAQVHKNRLPPATLAAIRYAATIVLYLSSTSEIFLRGVGTSLWPPMILAGLAVAGALAGIMLRIRAFLYLGTSFTLLALITMVWHAARAIEHVWPWWAFGIGLGIAILVLFGVFEKNRPEMLALISRLRQWDQ